ncbi:amidase [Alcaligenaceae bacterium]|nr:amidase [Alcaligenaceae bacterium]
MLTEQEYMLCDAVGLAELVRRKETTGQELLDLAIERIAKINPLINAVVVEMYEHARDQLAQGLAAGPLAGVPFLLKDLRASYRGVESTAGSAFMRGVPDFDSVVTQRYKRAGLLIAGKTNVPEMGLSIDTQNNLFGATHNPWCQGYSAGGSSGGSAAAVAARLVPVAHATDGAGSIRVPSSCCGVFGLKTSRGRVTYGPDVGEELAGMSVQHVCSISVRDSALLLDIEAPPNPGDPYAAPPRPASYLEVIARPPVGLRIGLVTVAPDGSRVHPDCLQAVEDTAKLCESLGHHVDATSLDVGWNSGLSDAIATIMGSGMLANARSKAQSTGRMLTDDDFSPGVQEFLKIGQGASAADYYWAIRRIHQAARDMARVHQDFDLILTPTLTLPPQEHGFFDYSETGRADYLRKFWSVAAFMPLANASGQPAMTVPLHWNAQGLPIGVQFMAPFGDEETLLRFAAQLEVAQPWAQRMPELAADAPQGGAVHG